MVNAETPEARTRNPRGSGAQLRAEIIHGAGLILDETGSADAVTLRAIARRIAIAAPSIYAHFPDREAILTALVEDGFRDFRNPTPSATGAGGVPLNPWG